MIVNQRWLKIVEIEVRVARIDGRAVPQERMSKSRASIVLQRAKPGIGIDLITSSSQVAGAVIVA